MSFYSMNWNNDISADVLKVMTDFLHQWKKTVALNSTYWSWDHVESGVPQHQYVERYFFWFKLVTYQMQKQPPKVFCKKGVLRNFAKFTGKHLCQSLFFSKVAGLSIERFLWFLRNFWEHVFYRTPLGDCSSNDLT